MIQVTRLDHSSIVLNDDLIEHIQANPDTVISMTTGQTFTVLEPPPEIVELIRVFRRSLSQAEETGSDSHATSAGFSRSPVPYKGKEYGA